MKFYNYEKEKEIKVGDTVYFLPNRKDWNFISDIENDPKDKEFINFSFPRTSIPQKGIVINANKEKNIFTIKYNLYNGYYKQYPQINRKGLISDTVTRDKERVFLSKKKARGYEMLERTFKDTSHVELWATRSYLNTCYELYFKE
jgi:hypothetical protein